MDQHLGVALETAAAENDGGGQETAATVARPDRLDIPHRAVVVLEQATRGGAIVDLRALGHRRLGQGLDQGEAAANRRDPRRRLGDQVGRQGIETDTEAGQPFEGRWATFGEGADQLGIGEAQRLHQARPAVMVTRGFHHQVGIEVAGHIGHEVVLEIVGDGLGALHPHEGVGPARVAAALLHRRAFENGHPGALFERRHRRRKPGDAAAHDHHVNPDLRHGIFLCACRPSIPAADGRGHFTGRSTGC